MSKVYSPSLLPTEIPPIACAVVGFVLCTIPKLHYYTLIVSTGFVGATAFMLGVDCYTTANLKEVRVP